MWNSAAFNKRPFKGENSKKEGREGRRKKGREGRKKERMKEKADHISLLYVLFTQYNQNMSTVVI